MHAAHIQVKNGDKDGEFEWELFSRIETCFDHILCNNVNNKQLICTYILEFWLHHPQDPAILFIIIFFSNENENIYQLALLTTK